MKNPSLKDSCFSLNITDQDVKERKFTNKEGENREANAYDRLSDENPTLRSEGLAYEALPKVKNKLLPQDLKNKPLARKRKKRAKSLINGWICLNGALKLLNTMLIIHVWRK